MRVNFSKSLNLFTPAGLLALGLIWAGSAPAQSQNSSPSTPTTTWTENDINRRELTNFDRWMDDHPQVYQQLRNNPSLINDRNWLGQHPGVQKFLQNHPGVREEIKENPRRFINREERFERNGGDISRAELSRFDRGYLDEHPEVARGLAKNPGLVDDPKFMAQHPGLQNFLRNHPEIKEDLKQHPDAFMDREQRFEHNGGDISRAEAASGDRFLDSHPQIAEPLRKDPKLIDNKQFVQNHPELREYLKNHPGVREDWKQNPNAFMKRQRQFEKHEGGAPHGKGRI